MLISFTEGMLLGLGAAVPLGPVNIYIMHTAMKEYKSAVSIGFGALSADLLYLLLIFLGFVTLVEHTWLLKLLGIVGGVLLLYFALLIYMGRHKLIEKKSIGNGQSSLIKYYIKGFIITFLNPYTIAFWLSMTSYAVTKSSQMTVTILGMIVAIALWVIIMPYIIHRTKHLLSQNISYYLSLFSAFLLMFFGLTLLIGTFL